jgi:hypothetical protein
LSLKSGASHRLGSAVRKKGPKLLWFTTDSEHFPAHTVRVTVEMLKRHGFAPVYKETGGGLT